MNVFVIFSVDETGCDCCDDIVAVVAVATSSDAASVIIAAFEKSIVGVDGLDGYRFYRMEAFSVQS